MRWLRTPLVLLVFLSACATTLETVHVAADNRGWKLGSGTNRPGATLKEFIPANEDISNWSRMFTIQFLEGEQRSPATVMDLLRSQMRARCPDAKWSVVAQDTASLTYEWSISNCPGQTDQDEVARLLKGNDGVHRIAYVRKTPQLEPTERDVWLKALEQSYVTKGSARVTVAP